MKKILLTSTLLASLATAAAVTVTSCAPISTSQEIKKEEAKQDAPKQKETKKPAETKSNSVYAAVQFVAKEGQTGVTFIGATTAKAIVGKTFATVRQPTAIDTDGHYSDYWEYAENVGTHKKGDRVQNWDVITNNMKVCPYFTTDIVVGNCVGIAAINDSTVAIVNHGGNTPSIDYSTDGISWKPYNAGQPITVLSGATLYFKGRNDNGLSQSDASYTSFQIGGAVNINGKIMSLIDDGQGLEEDVDDEYCFYGLFKGCSGIVSISSEFFPKGGLSKYCYAYLFSDCTCLSDFPSTLLPVTELKGTTEDGLPYDGEMCYLGMFMNCDGLTELPENLLPATTLATYCYRAMFNGCDNLKAVPNGLLPADQLTYGCYYGMFSECENLTNIGGGTNGNFLPATHLAELCYCGLFANCKTLKNVPADLLSAVSDLSVKQDGKYLYTSCYNQMFYGCAALETAPNLPAGTDAGTGLCPGCYEMMFYNCYKLSTSPTLPATTMVDNCYQYMFCNAGLTSIPTLPATTLAPYCYAEMFNHCSKLQGDKSTSSLPATIAADYCYYKMFANCTAMTVAPSIALKDKSDNTTGLASHCCELMFMNCGLTISPQLLSVHTAEGCYLNMFNSCKSLTTVGAIYIGNNLTGGWAARGWTTDCCAYMFNQCTNLEASPIQDTSEEKCEAFIIIPNGTSQRTATTTYANRMFQGTNFWKDSGGPMSLTNGSWYHHATNPNP